jgi:hypothetical protein
MAGGHGGRDRSPCPERSAPARTPGSSYALTPSALALAAGLASLVMGLAPALLGQRALRTAIGLLLVVQGIVLARTGLAGPPGALEQLGIDGLVLALGISAALIAVIERRSAADASDRTPSDPTPSDRTADPRTWHGRAAVVRSPAGATLPDGRAMSVLLLAVLTIPGGLAAF